jgi:hypothetical protein
MNRCNSHAATILGALTCLAVPGSVAQQARDIDQEHIKVLRATVEYVRSQLDPAGITRFEARTATISDSRNFELRSAWETGYVHVLEASLGGEAAELDASVACDTSGTECALRNANSFVLLSRPTITGERAQIRVLVFEDLDPTQHSMSRAAIEITLHESRSGWTIGDVRVLDVQH